MQRLLELVRYYPFPANTAAMCEALRFYSNQWEILWVIALGYGAQSSVAETLKDSCRYRLDAKGNLIVPKRSSDEISWFVSTIQE